MASAIPLPGRLPPAPLVRRHLSRGLLLWAGAHAIYASVLLLGQMPEAAVASVLRPGVLAPLFVAITGALGAVHLRRAGERALLGNLGVSVRAVVAIHMIAAAAAEALIAAVGRLR